MRASKASLETGLCVWDGVEIKSDMLDLDLSCAV